MRLFLLAIALSLSCTSWAQQGHIPNHTHTPGAIDPGIKQENIADTICVPGYTKTVHPRATPAASKRSNCANSDCPEQCTITTKIIWSRYA